MAEFNLTDGCWRFHHSLGIAATPAAMPPAQPSGSSADRLLRFQAQPTGVSASTIASLQGTWYLGELVPNDPKRDAWDTPAAIGRCWAKVFAATHDTRHFVQIVQEGFALPATPVVNQELQVRMFTGRYFANERRFFGFGADNWASELFTFTLTYENPPA